MAKLGDYKLPTGGTGNITSVGDIISLVLGSMVLLFTFAWGQKLYQTANRVMPGPLKDNIDPIIPAPTAAAQPQKSVY